jgi:hypothetical protein
MAPTLTIRTHASAPATLILDEGVTIPGAAASATFSDVSRLQRLQRSKSLLTLLTDDVYGVNASTLILVDGGDVPQAQAERFLADLFLTVFTTAAPGVAPISPGGTTDYLRADGTWATPPGGGAEVLPNRTLRGTGAQKQYIFVGFSSAAIGSENEAAAEWKIYRYDVTTDTASFADGDELFDNIWDNRQSLTYP